MLREKGEQLLTKDPSKDFRQAVREVIDKYAVEQIDLVAFGNPPTHTLDEATTRILALCKEMLVEGRREPRWSVGKDLNEGWNAYNDSLLKQLGEK